MGIKYAMIHILMHFIFPIVISYFFGLNLVQFIIVLIGAIIIDLDHLSMMLCYGIRGTFRKVVVQGFGKVRQYPFHNFAILIITAMSAFLVLLEGFFIAGIFSLAIFLHLLWDMLEDVLIFKVGIKHWKVGYRKHK